MPVFKGKSILTRVRYWTVKCENDEEIKEELKSGRALQEEKDEWVMQYWQKIED